MKYLCLIYDDERNIEVMSDQQKSALTDETADLVEALRNSGHHLAAQRLQPVRAATTVRVRDGKLSVTDGPFAETKEQLGGFFMIEARDVEEAVQIAAKIPSARLGSIEVRPIMERHA